jgi:protein arginine kinase activator
MKCEICHTLDAQRAIRKRVNNEEQELYVCNVCAEAQHPPKKVDVSEEIPQDVMDVIKETLPEIMGMILGATVEFSGRIHAVKDPVCSTCGLSRSEYKKAARLGCAQCYETFAKDLDGLVDDMHCIPRHTGKAPKHPRPSQHVALLLQHLRTAEQEKRQIDADELKARIRQLGWDPEPTEESFSR